jgi:hypothetical protein
MEWMRQAGSLAIAVLLLLCVCVAGAQETAPYPNGTSGLKAGTVPPPGRYWLMYNRLYQADRSVGPNGRTAVDANGDRVDLDLTVYANVHRFLQSTDYEILGAQYAWNFVVPFALVDIDISNFGVHESEFRVADMNIEPFVIEWHEPQYDFGYVYGLFIPTADRQDARPALPGKAHWTNYFGVAGTYYFDKERLWALSALSRYEIAGTRLDKDIRAGDNFSFEWGFSRNIGKVMDIGISGYCSWQTTLDEGTDVNYVNVRDQIFAAGPEIQYYSPRYKLAYHFRYWREFGARDRPEGSIATLTFIKPY